MADNTLQGFKELQPGTTLSNGKYTIQKKIGEGGFGITYKAIQNVLNRPVCIKEYFPAGKCVRNTYAKSLHLQGFSEDQFEKFRQAFVKEAKTLANLQHPNIVEVIDIFDENNTSYMVMPFIEGKSLYSIVEHQGKLSYPDTVNYMAQITNAVGYIHKKNILHRDIKPDNIIITPEFKAVLIDFGSAREFVHDQTQAHTSVVSHGYAPTEQYTANSRKGAYTDIYAIGATFYFALTGKTPLEAAARLTEKMPEPKDISPKIPEEANRTILKAMQLKAENRHQSIQDFMDDLRNVKPSTLVNETIGGVVVAKKAPIGLILGIVVGSFLLLAGGGIWFYQHDKTVKEQNEAKRNMLDGKVDNLKIYLFKDAIYLCPMEGILDKTVYYKVLSNVQLETTKYLPSNDSLMSTYVYTGQMQDGYPNGYGEAIYGDKSIYSGMYSRGLRHGNNSRYEDATGIVFEGAYKNDIRSGFGRLIRTDRTVFEGTWIDGKINGAGRILDESGNVIETGVYSE